MRSDDDLLAHVRHEAGVRVRRRQRLVAGGVAAVAVLVLGLGGVALAGGNGPEDDVEVDGGPSTTSTTTTTTEAPTTTEVGTTTTDTTTTTAPQVTTSTTTAPPDTTTTEAPTTSTTTPPASVEAITEYATSEGIKVTGTLTKDPLRPGMVSLLLRFEAPHGSHPGANLDWGDGSGQMVGVYEEIGETSCDPLIDDDPTTNPEPDPNVGPVDETFTLSHQYPTSATSVRIRVDGSVSWCTSDEAGVVLNIDFTLP